MGPHSSAYRNGKGPHSAGREVQALAGRQHGVVSQAQLIAAGLSRGAISRRVKAGWLVRLHEGVYAVGHTALTNQSHLLAAVLAYGPQAVASHRAAGALWGILRGGSAIEVTAPRGRKPRGGIVLHRSRNLDADDRALIDAIPVTSLGRTLVDLADILPEKRLADGVHEAEVLRLFDLTQLNDALARVPGRKGRHKLKRVLAAYQEPLHYTRSRAERLVIEMCKEHGLEIPLVNAWVGGYEVDFYWPEARLVLEIDGEAFHRTTRGFHEDRRRDRALAAQGIHVVRATWRDVTEGQAELALELQRIRDVRRRR